jgi:hypothetical protein
MYPRRKGTFGILLPDRKERDPSFVDKVFYLIIVVCFVTRKLRAFWQIKVILLESAGITVTAWGEKKFDGLTRLGDHHVDLQAIKVALLAD